ncbi:8127_t:CDS:2 [Rhizophagus irregularis]|nr:8127_t:CDS:2 [Rhizophagus irregularis]
MNYMLGSSKFEESDSWVRPKKRNRPLPSAASDNLGNPYPSMIIEVCNTQSLPDHHQKSKQYFGFNCRKILTNKLDPADSSWFWTTSPERTTLNYITNTMGVPLNNIIGGGLTDPITGNNYSACNMAEYLLDKLIQSSRTFPSFQTWH